MGAANKRVLVTGAAGFVGANLTRRLLRDGHQLHLLHRPGTDLWRLESIRDEVELHPVDLSDRDGVSGVIEAQRPEWIFHLAAYGAYSHQTDPRRIARTNVLGTVNLVEACARAGFEAFVNTGSSSEYGFKDHAPVESEEAAPNSYYAVSKLSATLWCRFAARHLDLHLSTLRLYSVYGPYEEPSRLLPTLVVRGLSGELPELVSPDVARDFVYSDDVVEAYLLAAAIPPKEPGSIYNVGTSRQVTIREVVQLAREELPIKDEPSWGSMANRDWDTSVWVSEPAKIRDELGWEARASFPEGFRHFIEWLRRHPKLLTRYEKQLTSSR